MRHETAVIPATCSKFSNRLLGNCLNCAFRKLGGIIVLMLYTFGKLFFPTMLHREKELRARMRWVAIIFGMILVTGVIALIGYVHSTRPQTDQPMKPIQTKSQ